MTRVASHHELDLNEVEVTTVVVKINAKVNIYDRKKSKN